VSTILLRKIILEGLQFYQKSSMTMFSIFTRKILVFAKKNL